VGSGAQGRSYVINRDGYLFLSPVSWYRSTKGWDMSPSFDKMFWHFNRPLLPRCVSCHCDGAEHVPGTVNRYRLAASGLSPMGCERCHGPGELHVASRRRGENPGKVDHTIVNPRHLSPVLREAVCQQCHLQGDAAIVRRGRSLADYRPGLPLHAFLAVYVRPPELAQNYKAVGHVEQLQFSGCFTGSGGRLGCTSCHDPHAEPAPADRAAHYRKACLACHDLSACHAPAARRQARGDSCIACHMPRASSSNIAHAAVTDHRIPRSADRPPRPRSGLKPGAIPLRPFYAAAAGGADPEAGRDLALAMMQMAKDGGDRLIVQTIAQRALPLLGAAVERAPGDVPALADLGHAYVLLEQPGEALPALERALARAPRLELALRDAARAALDLDRPDAAVGYARRLVAVNPWDPYHQALLARTLAKRGDWPAALRICRTALALDPANISARTLLVSYQLHLRDRAAAQAEFDRLLALDPPEREELVGWFEGQAP
jgi:tetratricopeptide (TPR) repeat protein